MQSKTGMPPKKYNTYVLAYTSRFPKKARRSVKRIFTFSHRFFVGKINDGTSNICSGMHWKRIFAPCDSSRRKCIRKCVKTFYAVCPQTCKIPFHRLISRTYRHLFFSPKLWESCFCPCNSKGFFCTQKAREMIDRSSKNKKASMPPPPPPLLFLSFFRGSFS